MSEPNAHAALVAAWSRVLSAVVSEQLQPLVVVQHLDRLLNGGEEKAIEGVELLLQQMEKFSEQLRTTMKTLRQGSVSQNILNMPIHGNEFGLSFRARRALRKLEVETAGDLTGKTGDELLELKNFGITTLQEVRDKLAKHGLKLLGE